MNRGCIYYIMGKSSSGKDTIYRSLKEHYGSALASIVPYTTRPSRSGEQNGREYRFVSEEEYLAMKERGGILEERSYQTVAGLWRYFTALDEQLERVKNGERALMVGTLESYASLKEKLGEDMVIPLYIELEDGLRLARALERERSQEKPAYREMCRRYLADCEDFSEERIRAAGIVKRFDNTDLEHCLGRCMEEIDARQE